jgi:hypothetical protein
MFPRKIANHPAGHAPRPAQQGRGLPVSGLYAHQHTIDGGITSRTGVRGGETRLDNLLQLCRYHHRLVHEGGFTCTKNTAGRVAFHDRNGRRIESSGKLPAVRPSIDITEQMRDRYEDLFIDEVRA